MFMDSSFYYTFLFVLSIVGLFTYVALHFVTAGYGMFRTNNWGITINNRLGWFIMEVVVFILLPIFWLFSTTSEIMPIIFLILFEIHYIQRSFIFPFLMKPSRMPITIMFLSILFNIVNAYTQAGWLFFYHPDNYYDNWLSYPMFWIGLVLFISGMAINIHSDHIIRNLRKPGEQGHKLPVGGLFDYVTSANYFGELLEWFGYTVLTCSPGALVFFWWTFANLCPRAKSIHKKYRESFKDQVGDRKILIPFIY